mmetsp:Transcript_3049/g.6592  ORF Transcript_3049/g.6592 Transcript_3049/m.6592 type:complete len:100 (-) Transcript_3049:502-801(-)
MAGWFPRPPNAFLPVERRPDKIQPTKATPAINKVEETDKPQTIHVEHHTNPQGGRQLMDLYKGVPGDCKSSVLTSAQRCSTPQTRRTLELDFSELLSQP